MVFNNEIKDLLTLVSSQNTRSQVFKSSKALKEISLKFPMGVGIK